MATEELCLICWARGRGGMNLGPGGISTNFSNASSYVVNNNNQRNNGGGRGGNKGVQLGNGRRSMGGMNRMSVANSKTGHSLHMRGLPFEATAADVVRFFAPLHPVDIRLLFEPNTGRPKGECDVDFTTHGDAEEAMKKDKQNMGHRYIELFLKSTIHGNAGKSWNNNHNTNNMTTNNNNNDNNNNNTNMNNGIPNLGKDSPPLLNGNRHPAQQSMNNIYGTGGGGFNGQGNQSPGGRFNNNVLPPIGSSNFNSPSVGFVGKPTNPSIGFGRSTSSNGPSEFTIKDGELDINMAYQNLQNGSTGGINSFYGNGIH